MMNHERGIATMTTTARITERGDGDGGGGGGDANFRPSIRKEAKK
jgi:hypothetical protein